MATFLKADGLVNDILEIGIGGPKLKQNSGAFLLRNNADNAAANLTIADITAAAATFSGNVGAVDGTFSGDISGVGGTLSGNLSAVGGTFSGNIGAVDGTLSGDLSAVGGTFSGNLGAVGGTFSGNVSAVDGTFSGDASVTGLVTGGNYVTGNGGEFRMKDSDGSNVVKLKAPALTSDLTLILPSADGSSGQFLKTDGSGNLSFATVTQAADNTFWLDPVRVSTQANLAGYTYDNAAGTLTAGSNGAISVDSVALGQGDRVLVHHQSTAAQNGVYSVTTQGDGSTAAVLTRATDMDESDEFSSRAVVVEEGTNGDEAYLCTNDGSVTLGTTNVAFVKIAGATVDFSQLASSAVIDNDNDSGIGPASQNDAALPTAKAVYQWVAPTVKLYQAEFQLSGSNTLNGNGSLQLKTDFDIPQHSTVVAIVIETSQSLSGAADIEIGVAANGGNFSSVGSTDSRQLIYEQGIEQQGERIIHALRDTGANDRRLQFTLVDTSGSNQTSGTVRIMVQLAYDLQADLLSS